MKVDLEKRFEQAVSEKAEAVAMLGEKDAEYINLEQKLAESCSEQKDITMMLEKVCEGHLW